VLQTTFNLLVGGTAIFPQSAQHCLVSLNGVLQAPISSYTISGSTIVFASALTTDDSIDFITILGDTLDLGVPSDDTVGAAQIKADLISGTTALTATPATTDELLISDAGVLKRIDAQFFQNTPAFEAFLSSNTAINDDTVTKAAVNTEVFDTDGCYDNSTNYRFTPTTAGKYFVYARGTFDDGAGQLQMAALFLYKNGSNIAVARTNFDNTMGEGATPVINTVVDMNGSSDYLEVFAQGDSNDGGTVNLQGNSTERSTNFGAYKLIGV
jgi:hypothetical protein